MRQPTGRMLPNSGQAAEKADATTDLTTSERPLHNYVAEVSERTDVRIGVPLPLGTYARGEGVNFAFFSRHANRVRLELFDQPADATPAKVIDLDPACNRTGDVWHVWVEGIRPGQLYAYRVDGPYQPGEGHRFNFHKLLLDPFATAVSPLSDWDFGPARGYDPSAPERDLVYSKVDDAGAMPKCVFTHEHFHWRDDRPLRHPWSKAVIYEAHVRGFTIEGEQSALYLIFNAGADAVDFGLPPVLPGARWHLAADTSREAPQDLFAAGEEPLWENPQTYHLSPRSSAILLARRTNGQRSQTTLTEAK